MRFKVSKVYILRACGEDFKVGDIVIIRWRNRIRIGKIAKLDDTYLAIESLPGKRHCYTAIHIKMIKKIKHYKEGMESTF